MFRISAILFLISPALFSQAIPIPAHLAGIYPLPGGTNVPTNTLIANNRAFDPNFTTTVRLSGSLSASAVPLQRFSPPNYIGVNALRPASQLSPNTRYDVIIQASAPGGPFPSFSYNFTTGAGPDNDPPKLVSVSPEPDLPADPSEPIMFRFSKPLLSAGGARPEWGWETRVLLGAGFQTVENFRLSDDHTAIVVAPNPAIRALQVSLFLGALPDTSGNFGVTLPSHSFRFHRAVNPSGFSVEARYPENGQTDVPTNATVQIVFNRALPEGLRWEASNLPVRVSANGESVTVSVSTFAQNRGLLVTPAGGWRPNAPHKVTVSAGIFDIAGIPLSAEHSFEFVSGKGPGSRLLPALAGFSPNNFGFSENSSLPSAGAPSNSLLVVRAANPLPPLVTRYVTSLSGSSAFGSAIPVPIPLLPALSGDSLTLTLKPAQDLPVGRYSSELPPVLDIYGQEVARALSFSIVPPYNDPPFNITGVSPFDGAENFPATGMVSIAASRALSAAQPAGGIAFTRDGEPVPGRWQLRGASNLAFIPAAPLTPSTSYNLAINAVVDTTGASASGPTVRFRTAPAGFVAPFNNDSVTPANGTPGIGVRQPIRITFGNVRGSADIRCSVSARLLPVGTPAFSQFIPHQLSWESNTLIITPITSWPAGAILNFYCSSEGVSGFSSSASPTYTTETPSPEGQPSLLAVDPPPGSIYPNDQIRLTFSEPMFTNSDTLPGLAWVGAAAQSPLTGDSISWSADRRTATLFAGSLRGNATLVPTETLTSFNGARVAPFALSYSGTGITRPTKPSIQRTLPAGAPLSANLEASITLVLTGPAPLEDIRQYFRVFAGDLAIPGEWSLAPGRSASDVFVFRPSRPYPPDSTVQVVDFGSVVTPFNNLVAFRTASAPVQTSGRRFLRYSPNLVPANGVLEVELSADPAPGEFAPQLFRTSQSGARTPLPSRWDLVRPRIVRLVPESPLTPGSYFVVADSRWASPTGSGSYDFGFQIYEPITNSRPNIAMLAPARDAVNVSLTSILAVTFEELLNPFTLQPGSVTLRANGEPIHATIDNQSNSALYIQTESILPPNATIEVALSGLEDRLGRSFPQTRWSFRTGETFDRTGPNFLWEPPLAPAYSARYATADPSRPVSFTFDEPLDPVHVLANSFIDNSFIASGFRQVLSPDLRTLTFLLPRDWPHGETVSFSPAVRDLSGNLCDFSICRGRTVRFLLDADTTPPILESVSIPDGETGVPLNPYFSFAFDSPVDSSSIGQVRLLEGAAEIPLRPALLSQAAPSVLRVTPDRVLKPLTRYTLRLEGAVDPSGNALAGGPRVYSFTTGETADLATPAITFPTRAPVGGQLRVRFSEPMDLTATGRTTSAILSGTDTGTSGSYPRQIPVRLVVSEDRREATVIPEPPLPAGKYRIGLPSAIDRAGNAPPNFPLESDVEFTGEPEPPPVTIRIFPADGATDVPLNVNASVTSTIGVLRALSVRFWEEDILLPGVQPSGRSLRFSQPLKPGTRYRIEVFYAMALNGLLLPPASSTFTTSTTAPDRTPLPFLGTSPEDGASGVPPETPFTFNFGRNIHPESYIPESVQFTAQPGTARVLPQYEVNGASIVARPAPFWPPASQISVFMEGFRSSGFDSLSGPIDYAGLRPNRSITATFRTAAPVDPQPLLVESVVPSNNATLPALNGVSISIRFSKPVIIAPNSTWVLVNGQQIGGDCGLSLLDYRTCEFSLRLSPLANVKVFVTNGVKDHAGNAIEPFTLEYKSGDAIPSGPVQVTLVEPSSFNALATAQPLIRFDRAMNVSSVRAGLRVTQDGLLVPGELDAVDAANSSFRFRPAAPFTAGAQVRVILPLSIQDTEGRTLPDWQLLSFQVQRPAGTLSIRGASLLSAHPANAPIDLTFDGPLDPNSVNEASLWLTHNGRLVPARVALSAAKVARLTPDEPLVPGAAYTITVGSAIRGEKPFPGADIRFIAGESAEPRLLDAAQILWLGRPATRLRWSHPITPAEAELFSLDAAHLSPDGTSLIVPGPLRKAPAALLRRR